MKYERYPKRDAIRNYFPLPNEVFRLGMDSSEIAVYSYLMFLEDRDSHQCWPSYKTIGMAVHMSENTVRKYVQALEDKGLILTEPTNIRMKSGRKRNGNLLYTIRPIQEAVNVRNARQSVFAEAEIARQAAARRAAEYDHRHPEKPLCAILREPSGTDAT